MLGTFVEAAIWTVSPVFVRPRWFCGGDRFCGIGPAKVSDAEMEGNYGVLVDDEHQKVGLDLRDGPCARFTKCIDQSDPDIATLAMKTRITIRLDVCVKNGCTSTDMAMVALLAADERITPQTLNQAFKSNKYNSENELVTLDWEKFLEDNWTRREDQKRNSDLIELFSENVQERKSQDFPEIDWVYMDGLAQ